MSTASPRVAIVGAGLAGLAAASELRRLGIDALLLEGTSGVGGRARTLAQEGFLLEPLSPVLSTADHELLGWVAGLALQDELLPLRPVVEAQVHRGRATELDPRGLLDLARLPGVRPLEGLRLVRLPRLLRRYAPRIDPERPERGAPLDDRSLADFGRLYFGRSVLDRWLAPFTGATSLGDDGETSRVQFLLRHRRHFGARRALPRAPLSELAAAAASGVPLLAGARVTALEPRPGGSALLVYTRDGRERLLEVAAVVLAVAAPEAARLGAAVLTRGERDALAAVRYAPAVSVAVAACRPPGRRPLEIRVPRAEGSPLETALLEPGMPGGRVPDGYGMVTLHASASWSARALELPDERVEQELLDAFEGVRPGTRAALSFARVLRTGRARPRFDVGHFRRLARLVKVGAERRAEGRRVYLAGDYRADPSWNGAVASGLRTAREVAADLG